MNNPPAFPTKSFDVERQTWVNEEGLSLRDYFAAKAMLGLTRHLFAYQVLESKHYVEDVSKAAYLMADAMLKARES